MPRVRAPYPQAAAMREASPYPVEAPMTRTLRGAAPRGGGNCSATAICRSTFRRQPSGCALTQIKPRERRLMTCRVMRWNRYATARAADCPANADEPELNWLPLAEGET